MQYIAGIHHTIFYTNMQYITQIIFTFRYIVEELSHFDLIKILIIKEKCHLACINQVNLQQ